MKTKVLLADDHTIVREGLRAIIQLQEDMEIVGEAENGRDAVRMAKELTPDVVVLDLLMPLLNGLESARQIRKEVPSCRVLMLSASSHEDHVRQMVEVGATGYILKQTAGEDLIKAIRLVCQGKKFFSPSVAKCIENRFPGALLREGSSPQHLTSRENEVLQLVAEGYSNKMMADILQISIKTIEKHRQSLMRKLNIHEAATLTRYAIEHGIVESTVPPQPPTAAGQEQAPTSEQPEPADKTEMEERPV